MRQLFQFLLVYTLWPVIAQAQIEPNVLRIGSFEVEKTGASLEKNLLYSDLAIFKINSPLNLPKITTSNYREPVNMSELAMNAQIRDERNKSHKLINNIRGYFGDYNKRSEANARLQLSNKSQLDNSLYGTCVHGRARNFCNFCSPYSIHNQNPFYSPVRNIHNTMYHQPYIYY